jgi:hypothetical protein
MKPSELQYGDRVRRPDCATELTFVRRLAPQCGRPAVKVFMALAHGGGADDDGILTASDSELRRFHRVGAAKDSARISVTTTTCAG